MDPRTLSQDPNAVLYVTRDGRFWAGDIEIAPHIILPNDVEVEALDSRTAPDFWRDRDMLKRRMLAEAEANAAKERAAMREALIADMQARNAGQVEIEIALRHYGLDR